MECVRSPNTNALKQIFPAGENETKNFFSDSDIYQQKFEILCKLKSSGIELGRARSLLESTRPSADKHESPPAEKNVVTSDTTRKQQKMASQTSYDPLEKLSAGFFGMLEDYSRDKAFRCDGMEQILKLISDRKVTKDTLYQKLVECCKEKDALPPPPPPTKDFSSNLGENEMKNFFSDFDIQQQKSEILSVLKMSRIELGCGGSLVETRPSADKHESPAEKNVVTSDSARVQQKRKKRSPISDDPLQKEDLDSFFETFQVMLQYEELPCDDMEHVRLSSALCEKQAMRKRRFLKVDDQEN